MDYTMVLLNDYDRMATYNEEMARQIGVRRNTIRDGQFVLTEQEKCSLDKEAERLLREAADYRSQANRLRGLQT